MRPPAPAHQASSCQGRHSIACAKDRGSASLTGTLRGAGFHIRVAQGADVHAGGAVGRFDGDVDDNFVGVARQPPYLNGTLRIAETR